MKPRYRVLYVENSSGVGGSVISLYRLVQRLNRDRYEPRIAFHRPNGYAERFIQLGVSVFCLHPDWVEPPASNGPARDVAARLGRKNGTLARLYREAKFTGWFLRRYVPDAVALSRLIAAQKIDVLHLNNGPHSNHAALLAAWWSRRPCVCHVRDYGAAHWLDHWLSRRVDYYAFMSTALQEQVKADVPELRGGVIFDGLDLHPPPPTAQRLHLRQQLGLGAADFVVGNVGRITTWKGQDVFLRALARIRTQTPGLKALIVGEPDPPSEQAYLEQLRSLTRELGLEDVVIFTGYRPDIPAVMSALDLLVHSSCVPEPFGIVLIEGMAAGLPVVATRAGGVLDIVQEGVTGWLVPIRDDLAMAAAIAGAAQDRELAQRLGQNGRQQALSRFSVAQYAAGVEAIYADLIGAVSADLAPA
jgi:glycosyltransferase involved in cell wall biosynthesis